MHGEHDALPVVASNGDRSLFVAATLAALVLAGSALVYRKTHEQQPQRGKLIQPFEQSTPDDMENETYQPLDVHGYVDRLSSAHDPDSKESKSSRSKDRRRRGKDPLKEILKGGKKLKTTPPTPVKQSFTGKPIIDDLDNTHFLNNINNIPTPSTPASSSTTNSTSNSFSRGSGKRAQRDDDGTKSNIFSVQSRTTSEVSQSNTGSRIPAPHPHQHVRNRTASSTSISEDNLLPPSRSSSSSSSRNETEDNTSISHERDPDILSRQARETHLAIPTPSIFSTTQNNDDFGEIVNHSLPSYSSSASSATNTTTESCVITPATSPSLSFTSSKLVHAPSPGGVNLAPNNESGSDCGPKNNPPSHALDTDRNTSRKEQQLRNPNPTPSKSKSKIKTSAPNPWEWNSAGDAVFFTPSSSSASLSTPTSSLTAVPAFPPDIVYRKRPRLQPKPLWSKNDASPSIPSSVSHPSLLSPTSGNFVPVDSALLSPSISSSLEKVSSRMSKVVEGEGGESDEVDGRHTPDESYTQLEFPTLNPTVSNSSSLASNGNASSPTAGPSHNHRPTPRRANSSRRPSTPSSSTPISGSGSLQSPAQLPAVSTQTQLASLRGALEAARLREEKHKAEMDRCTKELEVLRWESANSKRGEVELQNHIRHLMHQLHMYTSLFTSVSPPPTSLQQPPQQTQAGIADGVASGPGSGNGPTATSSPGTQDAAMISGPLVSPGLPNMLPPLQLNRVSSPISTNGVFPPPIPSMHTPSSYFPYPMPLPPLNPHAVMPSPHPMFAQQFHHMQQQFLQFQPYQQHQPHQSQSPTIQAQQANLISMLHTPLSASASSHQPYATPSSSRASGSRSSSRLGTESTGSLSPDLNGSPSPVPGGKRRTRRRTQTVNGYGGRVGLDDMTDGWVSGSASINEDDEREHESIHEFEEQGQNSDGDEDNEFSGILAEAIFKRPESIGVRSGKKIKQALSEKGKEKSLEQLENEVLDGVEPLTEFKFPSLSDLGNVYNGSRNQSWSSSSPVVVSPAPEDLGPNVFHQALADRPPQDIVRVEGVMSQNTRPESESTPSVGKNQNQMLQNLQWI